MSRHNGKALLVLAAALLSGAAAAQDLSGEKTKSLDGQVQEIKSDVLNIASELRILEERLLYPSGTQLSIFVTLDENEPFRLDAVQIEIDGELATHHIYSFNELEALRKGGVQRVYTGNVMTGNHDLHITVLGKTDSGEDFSRSGSYGFSKGVKPKMLGINLAEPGFNSDGIQVGDW